MGKKDVNDPKKAEKRARKREKEARKHERRLKKEIKEEKRRQREARKQAICHPRDKNHQELISQPLSKVVSSPFLKDSLEDLTNTVFYKKQIEVSLSLLPAAMGNIQAALEDSIRSMLLKYIKGVGLLLTFQNLKVLSNNGHGMILDELPYLNFKVGFEGLSFCPKVGSKLQGMVSDSFPSHLGILVLGYVNAMIPAQHLQDYGYKYDYESFVWAQEDGSHTFSKDEKVEFIVDKIHESVGTISMEGSKPTQFVLPSN